MIIHSRNRQKLVRKLKYCGRLALFTSGLSFILAYRLSALESAPSARPTAASEFRQRLPIVLANRPSLGSVEAPIVVVEVSSFKCTHCRKFHETVFPRLIERYINPGHVQWVVLNASDDPSDQFSKIFDIARCANQQGKYWDMLDSLFQVAHRAPSMLESLVAKSAHINRDELDMCLRERPTRNTVVADFSLYARLKLKGTPSFLIWKMGPNGQTVETSIAGAQTLDQFQRVFDELLKTL
jgi:protein-disulfide isomerase